MAHVVMGAAFAELQNRVDSANRSVVLLAGLTYADLVIRLMRDTSKSGFPGPVRRRSAPGEPPAVQYGTLIRDIAVNVAKVGGTGWVATVGLRGKAPYGIDLEFGSGQLAPRPTWRPAFSPAIAMTKAKLGRAITGTASIAPATSVTITPATAAAASSEAA